MLLTTPQFNFVFQIDAVFFLDAVANLFGQRQRVGRPCIFAFSHDEVGMFGRNNGAAPASAGSTTSKSVERRATRVRPDIVVRTDRG